MKKCRSNIMQRVERVQNTILDRIDRERGKMVDPTEDTIQKMVKRQLKKMKKKRKNRKPNSQSCTIRAKRVEVVYHKDGQVSWTAPGTKPPRVFDRSFLSTGTESTRPHSVQICFESLDNCRQPEKVFTTTSPCQANNPGRNSRRLSLARA